MEQLVIQFEKVGKLRPKGRPPSIWGTGPAECADPTGFWSLQVRRCMFSTLRTPERERERASRRAICLWLGFVRLWGWWLLGLRIRNKNERRNVIQGVLNGMNILRSHLGRDTDFFKKACLAEML